MNIELIRQVYITEITQEIENKQEGYEEELLKLLLNDYSFIGQLRDCDNQIIHSIIDIYELEQYLDLEPNKEYQILKTLLNTAKEYFVDEIIFN